jgi:hypothetical protein
MITALLTAEKTAQSQKAAFKNVDLDHLPGILL